MDVKPSNFLVYENGDIKISDFGLIIKKDNPLKLEIIEGDCRYHSLELLNESMNNHRVDFKTDIFALGLSIAELLFKLELPKNGPLWEDIRTPSFKFKDEIIENSDIKGIDPNLLKLIYWMMSIDPKDRPSTTDLLKYVPELEYRNLRLGNHQYKKAYTMSLSLIEEENELSFL